MPGDRVIEKDLQVVGFRIGDETFGVRIGSVREIVRVPKITAVPNAPDTIEGAINLRGKIIPVLDLRKRLGQTQVQHERQTSMLVVRRDNRLVSLRVMPAAHDLN